jgi:hypothetical protein
MMDPGSAAQHERCAASGERNSDIRHSEAMRYLSTVMAGLDPAIHVFVSKQDVDHRDKPGDDEPLKRLLA